jgi:hypothetical protein
LHTLTHPFAAGDGIGAAVVGTTITVYSRTGTGGAWTVMGSVTDSSITTGGRVALQAAGTAVSFTNFGGGGEGTAGFPVSRCWMRESAPTGR